MEIDVLPDLAVLGELRRSVAAHLLRSGWPAGAVENAVLVVSELLTNAIIYGRPPIRLSLAQRPEVLRLEVDDAGGGQPTLNLGRANGAGGFGLQIVDALAARWGVEDHAPGKAVWVELVAKPTA
ncbi:MAG: ATP-binding protein, partial [Acidimicrobiales bacterium]